MIKLLKPDRFSIRDICLEAGKLFQDWHLGKNKSDDLVLAIEEALTNIMEHGYKFMDKSGGKIILEIIQFDCDVIVIINDNADHYSIENTPIINRSTYVESNIIGGFGISIIKKLMDSVKLLRIEDRNILLMTKVVK